MMFNVVIKNLSRCRDYDATEAFSGRIAIQLPLSVRFPMIQFGLLAKRRSGILFAERTISCSLKTF